MKSIILFAALASAHTPLPASAQSPLGGRAEMVRYADLDLSRPEDIRKLDRRIGLAAARLCGVASDVDLAGRNAVRRCRRESTNRAAAARDQAIAALTEMPVEVAVRER